MIFPILGFERFLELCTTLVNTFKDIYHIEEEKFNRDSMKEAFCSLSLITLNFIVTVVFFIMAITLLATTLLQKSS